MQVVVNFKMPGKVHRAAMSNLSTSHMLIAAATEDVQVRLCDIASGAFAHTLSGHRGMYVNTCSVSFIQFVHYVWVWFHVGKLILVQNFTCLVSR